MAVPNKAFLVGDVDIDYPQETVLFRYEKATGKSYRKFYGDAMESEITHSSTLSNEAILMGEKITAKEYAKWKSAQ